MSKIRGYGQFGRKKKNDSIVVNFLRNDTKWFGRPLETHIAAQNYFSFTRLGGSLPTSRSTFFRGKLRVERLPLPNVVDTKSFWHLI